PHELLPDGSIVPLDIAYEVVAHILQSPEQARRDFLEHGRGDRLPRLRWYRAVNSWVDDDEELAPDFLKRCELVEDGWHLDLAVRGEIKPNGPHTTTEVNGKVLFVRDNDDFGLSRDGLIEIYPALAQSRSQPKRTDDADFNDLEARVRRTVLMLDDLEDKGTLLTGIKKQKLAEMLSTSEAPISVRTLFTAEAYRKQHPR